MDNYESIASSYRDQLLTVRRELHRHPELSFEEFHTAAMIRQHLSELGISLMEGVRGNSTVGILKGDNPGPTLLFRADIDALPITEASGLDFASETPGIMHACGHDAHTSTLLAFADYMAKHRERINGTLKLCFQQGEDKLPGGGRFIVEDGVLDDVDYAVAWHCAPELEVGTVSITGGPRTASVTTWHLEIHGVGGHGGFPFRAVDPISTAALIIEAYNQLPNWTVAPLDSTTFTISHLQTGHAGIENVIPQDLVMEGHFRCLRNDTAVLVRERVQTMIDGICKAKGCTYDFHFNEGYPALFNDPEMTGKLYRRVKAEGVNAIEAPPIMGAEDFAYYSSQCRCTYFNCGTRNVEKFPNSACPPHNPAFTIDEEVMVHALRTMLICYDELKQQF